MWLRILVIGVSVWCVGGYQIVWPGPSKGDIYPRIFRFDPSILGTKVERPRNCYILEEALKRFNETVRILLEVIIANQKKNTLSSTNKNETEDGLDDYKVNNEMPKVTELKIRIKTPCNGSSYPYFKMKENYSIKVEDDGAINLQADAIWGILRGLETLTQIFFDGRISLGLLIPQSLIEDEPKYPHRGLMLDTARHFIPVQDILLTLDAMAMNKMNVFHWHIIDDESFPFQSEVLPELWQKGAYHPKLVYTKSDINKILEYARLRGIRVIPELDIPGHIASLAAAYPEVIIDCEGTTQVNPFSGKTFELLQLLFVELIELFPDKQIHIGGRDVGEMYSTMPWLKCKDIQNFCLDQKMSIYNFTRKFYESIISVFPDNKRVIFCQDIFESIKLSPLKIFKDAVVEIASVSSDTIKTVEAEWKANEGNPRVISGIVEDKKFVILSYPFSIKSNIRDMFGQDPRDIASAWVDSEVSAPFYVIGGEAPVWTEDIDKYNLQTSIWPVTLITAEMLWTKKSMNWCSSMFYMRMRKQLCSMSMRGVLSAALGPETACITSDAFVKKNNFEETDGYLL